MAFRRTVLGTMNDDEARHEIGEALDATSGNVARAAHLLGISRRQLYRYLWQIAWPEADRARAEAMRVHLAARARLGVKSPDGSHDPRG